MYGSKVAAGAAAGTVASTKSGRRRSPSRSCVSSRCVTQRWDGARAGELLVEQPDPARGC